MADNFTDDEERELKALWYLCQAHVAEFLGAKCTVPAWVKEWQKDNLPSPYTFWLGADA